MVMSLRRVPFIIYADLESLLEKLDNEKNKIQKHVACLYGYKVVCCYDDKISKPYKQFRGENSIHKFFEEIFQEEEDKNEKLKLFKNTDMIMTSQNKVEYRNASNCYVCKKNFSKENFKVKDHCHVLGNYRGAACNVCNLNMKMSNIIPVVFHNLRGYDSHLLMQELGKFGKGINIIPNNMEKYMSFSVGNKIKYYNKKKG